MEETGLKEPTYFCSKNSQVLHLSRGKLCTAKEKALRKWAERWRKTYPTGRFAAADHKTLRGSRKLTSK
jgi:hypothetical protein